MQLKHIMYGHNEHKRHSMSADSPGPSASDERTKSQAAGS